VSDWIRILSDRPSTGKPNDPGRRLRMRGLVDRARVGQPRVKDASAWRRARLLLRIISGRASSSCGVSFSTGEASSGDGSSLSDSERRPTPTDTSARVGATCAKTSHASRHVRHDRTQLSLKNGKSERTTVPQKTSHRSGIEVMPARRSLINIIVPSRWSHIIQVVKSFATLSLKGSSRVCHRSEADCVLRPERRSGDS
jgi:hypothetical protein